MRPGVRSASSMPRKLTGSSSSATIVEESGDESINKAVGPVKSDLPSPKAIVGAVKDDWPLYSCRKEDYTIGEPIGRLPGLFVGSCTRANAVYVRSQALGLPRSYILQNTRQ